MFSKCCFEVLTSSYRASPWDVSGLPILSSSHVTLGEWVERSQQLQDISSVLWTNMAVPSVAEFRYSLPRVDGTAPVFPPEQVVGTSVRAFFGRG